MSKGRGPVIDPYGVHGVTIGPPAVFGQAKCNDCRRCIFRSAHCEYHWHGALMRQQVIFCESCGHAAFKGRPERIGLLE